MFGDNLKKYRQQKGYSQFELANKLFVSRQCVSKWEKGVTQPDLETLNKLSELLDVSIDVLIKEVSSCDKRKANFNRIFFTINVIVALFCVFTFVSLCRCLPSVIPAHWTHGTIDRYGNNMEILLHLVLVAVLLIVDVSLFFTFKKIYYKWITVVAHVTVFVFQLTYLILIVVLYAKYLSAVIPFLTAITVCIIMCVAIASHPKIVKQNQWLGVRTHETLSNVEVWNKTNSLACYLFVSVGAAIFSVNLITLSDVCWIGLVAFIIPLIVVIVYAKCLFARISKNGINE